MTTTIKVGDMVRFFRGLYTHWGVCVSQDSPTENAQLVHVSPADWTEPDFDPLGVRVLFDPECRVIVRQDSIVEVAAGDEFEMCNYLDEQFEPKTPENIVEEAMKQLKEYTWNYDLRLKNCEAFAIWLRYRIEDRGQQVKNVETAVALASAAAKVAHSHAGKKDDTSVQ